MTGGVGACDVGGRCSLRFGLLSSASALARTSGDVRFCVIIFCAWPTSSSVSSAALI